MASDSGRLRYLKNVRVLLVLGLIIAGLAGTIYNIASDMSVHGLATKIYYGSRYCTTPSGSSAKIVTFSTVVSVWSSSALHTSISHVTFSLSADGTYVGSLNAADSSWDPGKGASYTPTFSNPALNTFSLPAISNLILSITAQVTAGTVTAQVTASDNSMQDFGTTSC